MDHMSYMLPWYVVSIKEWWLQNTSWNHYEDKVEKTHQGMLHDATVFFAYEYG